VQGQGRPSPTADRCAPRAQEALERGHTGTVGEDPPGEEGERVLREVPSAGRPVGPRRRGRLSSAGSRSFMIERRRFLAKLSGVAAAAATINDAPKVIAQPKVQWRMFVAFPPALEIQKDHSYLLA